MANTKYILILIYRQLVIEKSELEKTMNEQRVIREKALSEQTSNPEKEKCSETLRNEKLQVQLRLSLIHISEPTRPCTRSRMPSSA